MGPEIWTMHFDEYAQIGKQDQSPVKRGPFVLLAYAFIYACV